MACFECSVAWREVKGKGKGKGKHCNGFEHEHENEHEHEHDRAAIQGGLELLKGPGRLWSPGPFCSRRSPAAQRAPAEVTRWGAFAGTTVSVSDDG